MTRRKRKNPAGSRTATDASLPAALSRLDNAIGDLCEPVRHMVDGQLVFAPSWYQQLSDARTSKRGIGNARAVEPIVECWLDALMLLDAIHVSVCDWVPVTLVCHAECVSVRGRLVTLREKSWRPQDCKQLDTYSATLESWVKQISALLSTETRLTLPNPCPECGKRTAYRIDSAGERVRCSALQVTVYGAECFACHSRWRPDQLTFLGRLLEYKTPEGVIE